MSYLSETFQPPDFIYALVINGEETTLHYSPQGWLDYATAWSRNKTYYGYGRVFTVSLQFYKDGFELLSALYEQKGIEAEAMIRIYRTDPADYTQWLDFEGDIDFSNCSVNHLIEGNFFECQIAEAGISKSLKAYEKNVFEYSFPNDAIIHIEDTINAYQTATWDVLGVFKGGRSDDGTFAEGNEPDMRLTANTRDASVSSNHTTAHDPDALFSSSGTDSFILDLLEYNDFKRKNTELTYRIFLTGALEIRLDEPSEIPSGGLRYFLPDQFTVSLSWNNGQSVPVYAFSGASIPVNSIIPIEIAPFEIHAGTDINGVGISQMLRLSVNFSIPATLTAANQVMACTLRLNVRFEGITERLLEPFDIRAMSLMDVFTRLAQNIDTRIVPKSDLLTIGAARDCYLTSGEGVKNFATAKLKISFIDLFQSIMSQFGACMFISGNEMRIERFEDAFREITVLDIGEVSSMVVKPAADWMFNTYRVGSKDVEYRSANGRYEFNSLMEFTLPVTRVDSEYNAESKIRFDSFGISDLKMQYLKDSTATSNSDNDVFMVHAVPVGNRLQPFNDVEIVGDVNQSRRTGAFNHYLSPKRASLRRSGLFSSVLARSGQNGGQVSYATFAKTDANLLSRLMGAYNEEKRVSEKTSFTVDASKNTFWPDEYEVTCEVPKNIVMEMRNLSNSGGYVRFTHTKYINGIPEQNEYFGFPVNCSEEAATGKAQKFTLLASKHGTPLIDEGGEDPVINCQFDVTSNAIDVKVGGQGRIMWTSTDVNGNVPIIVISKPDWLIVTMDTETREIWLSVTGTQQSTGTLVLQQNGSFCELEQSITVRRIPVETPSIYWTGSFHQTFWKKSVVSEVQEYLKLQTGILNSFNGFTLYNVARDVSIPYINLIRPSSDNILLKTPVYERKTATISFSAQITNENGDNVSDGTMYSVYLSETGYLANTNPKNTLMVSIPLPTLGDTETIDSGAFQYTFQQNTMCSIFGVLEYKTVRFTSIINISNIRINFSVQI